MILLLGALVAAGLAMDRALWRSGDSAAPTRADVVKAQGEAARAAAHARSLYQRWRGRAV